MPYKTVAQGIPYGLVPDGFLKFNVRREGQTDLSLPVLLEHDRGWEKEKQFKTKIAAYRAFIASEAYKQQFGVGTVTVIFTTYTGMERVAPMRRWTWDEVQSDPYLAGRFRFALLPTSPEPQHVLFDKRWYTLASDQPIALLEG